MRMIAQQHRTPKPPASAIAEANPVFGSRKLLRSHAVMFAPLATIPLNDDGKKRPVVHRPSQGTLACQRRRDSALALAAENLEPLAHHSDDAPRIAEADARCPARPLAVAPNRPARTDSAMSAADFGVLDSLLNRAGLGVVALNLKPAKCLGPRPGT